MRQILFFVTFITIYSLQAQFTVKGTIEPNHDYSWILLYKMQNGDQTYVANADVENGQFQFEIKESEPSGIYRAYYQIENNLYVEFIYNKEPVEFTFDPEQPDKSIVFTLSKENSLYRTYYNDIKSKQQKLDSVQVLYFESTDKRVDQQLEKQYKGLLTDLNKTQMDYEKKSETMLAHHFIKASAQYNSSVPTKDMAVYLEGIKEHFFDNMDLSDQTLGHSSFINDRLHDYVFYLNQDENPATENELQKKAIKKALQLIGNDVALSGSFEEDLLETYMMHNNVEMLHFVMDNYYRHLPTESQSYTLKKKVDGALKTAIGLKAPDIVWQEDGQKKSLYELTGTDYYIVLFFSSNCPHCQQEVPDFYDFISGIHNIKVIAVGLEDEKESWESMTTNYQEFINILDLEKWSSQKVKDYGITEIPTYFVLDADKKILAKPYDFDELKSMFETQKSDQK